MSRVPTPEAALARIGGWADASFEEISGGLTNRTFLVASGSKRAVLKIDDERRQEPFNSRDAEARIQARARAAGLAPAVIYSDEQCYLTEYVEGTVWTPEHLQATDNLQRLGRALRRLHALPLSGRTFDAPSAARLYIRTIDSEDPVRVEQCLEVIDSVPSPRDPCLCHNDLVAGNLVDSGDILFLDWEYACDNDPFFDLATIVAHHGLDELRTDALLTAYCNGAWHKWRPRLERQVANYEALLWLWSAAR